MPTNPNIKFYRAPEPTTYPGQPGIFLTFQCFHELTYESAEKYSTVWLNINNILPKVLNDYNVPH